MVRTALVTGASSGMGREIARRLAADGFIVYGAARRVERMSDLEREGVRPLRMDVSVDADVVAAVERIIAETGRIDVLVNNAGFGLYGAVEDTSMEDVRYQFDVNFFGVARLTQLVLPHMRAQTSGRIVNISSMGGEIYTPLGAYYHATKHALEAWSDALRYEVAPFGIDVVIVQPGLIDTEWSGIMSAPLMERSGHGAYAELARSVVGSSERTYGEGGSGGSSPTVISDAVSKAVAAKRPRTRYAVGRLAKPLIAARRVLSDRAFDRLLARASG
ncbi:short-chain dehydrogenase/reductase [Agromyces rhizosphaerae]|uniref:Short-chain dehydrogenase/reductase n=1 Tax=Agromyces rhizosphaerae TaxID=88374 RepID=A0A9W6CXA8_9MICO|nr:oxidoreductase [Agromyces rhizosphaerae]GLI26932.1 short-chain dehydrogenase/reductase [Agromyces rhizosphaerae]